MPFTPFHFGVALIIFATFSFLDPFSLFIASIVPDIEGIAAIFILPNSNLPLHGPLHSFTGGFLLAVISGLSICVLMRSMKINQINFKFVRIKLTLRNSLLSSLIGSFSHILFDGPLYSEMNLFYPIQGNSLYHIVPFSWPYLFCIVGFFLGIILLIIRLFRSENCVNNLPN